MKDIKEVRKALKRLIAVIESMSWLTSEDEKDVDTINAWLDKTAKDTYDDEIRPYRLGVETD